MDLKFDGNASVSHPHFDGPAVGANLVALLCMLVALRAFGLLALARGRGGSAAMVVAVKDNVE